MKKWSMVEPIWVGSDLVILVICEEIPFNDLENAAVTKAVSSGARLDL